MLLHAHLRIPCCSRSSVPAPGRGYVLVPRTTVGLDLLRSNTRNETNGQYQQIRWYQKALKKVEKQKATESAEEAQRREMMPYLTELMGRFETAAGDNFDGVKALSATVLKDILKLYYGVRLKGMSTMKKTDLVIEVRLIALRGDEPAAR